MLALSDREIADRYLTDLCAIFPQAKGVVSEIVIQRWPQGAVLGCPGWSTHAVRLASGHGRIAFAGDYMMPRDESEASASGRRAAILIRERLANPAARAL
jgi:oxygen-dependent protoporphyrinogen oxidase